MDADATSNYGYEKVGQIRSLSFGYLSLRLSRRVLDRDEQRETLSSDPSVNLRDPRYTPRTC